MTGQRHRGELVLVVGLLAVLLSVCTSDRRVAGTDRKIPPNAPGFQASTSVTPTPTPLLPRGDDARRWGKIVFASNRDGDFELFAINADGSGLRQLTDNNDYDGMPRWSPNGRQIVFVRAKRDHGYRSQGDIWVLEIRTGAERKLVSWDNDNYDPTWTPDGRWVTYVDAYDGSGILKTSIDGRRTRLVVSPPDENSYAEEPSWDPSGTRLAFQYDSGLRVSNRWGTGIRRLPLPAGSGKNPDWSPVADQILVSAYVTGLTRDDREPFSDLYVTSSDGREWRRVETQRPRSSNIPGSWSPDGTAITFTSDRGGFYDIFLIDADGTDIMRLTRHPRADVWPDWAAGKLGR